MVSFSQVARELSHRFFGNHSLALRCIGDTLAPATQVRIATAYFAPSGYERLQDALAGKEVRLLVGREEGGRDRVEEVIAEFVDNLAARPMARRKRAMRQLLDALERGLLVVAVGKALDNPAYLDARYLYQHAKLYIADETAAAVTSANLSYHGLCTSYEAGIRVIDPDDVRYFVEKFDEYFARAESITGQLIAHLQAWVQIRTPFEVYVRALLELYGLPEAEAPPQLPALAGYQRPVTSRVLQAISDHGGAMLVASTGLGKTVMAAHVVAYLRMQGDIDKVIVICPAGLRENWRRFMRAAFASSAKFSYPALSGDDPAYNASVRILEYELRNVTDRTLVILDESHHLRNAEAAAGDVTLRYQRVANAIHGAGAKLLMLTATPFSKGVDDVNNQLYLLSPSRLATPRQLFDTPGYWRIDVTAELPELPPCAVLTTPTVVRHFSHTDAYGERYVLFSGDEPRYFPRRLIIRTEPYDNPLDDLLVELLESRLLNQAKANDQTQPRLFGEDGEVPGQAAGFFNADVMRQFCSSPDQVLALFDKLETPGGFQRMRFARQQDLTQFVRHRRGVVECCRDVKFERLLDIVRNAGEEKAVVFCHYVETAKALAQKLSARLPDVRVETTAERDIDTVDNLLRVFAPIANEVPPEERGEETITVLVATGALAEGFNLQDASILVNYDLPWTVLVLAQRMGRVLRPWHTPREITIYNFIPSTMSDPRLHMALNWRRRLIERDRQHRSFADIPVLLDGSRDEEGLEMAALAQQLQDFDREVRLGLDETLRFIENAEHLQTSSFLDDLARLSEADIAQVRGLPQGFRSVRAVAGATRLFVLFQYRRRFYATLFDGQGKVVFNSERRDEIMSAIRCTRDEPIASPHMCPDDDTLDRWIDTARDAWAGARGLDAGAVQAVCALAMIGG